MSQTNHSAKLYLAGTRLFANEQVRQQLLPALTRPQRHDDMLAELGFIPRAFADERVVLLRPHWHSPDRSAEFKSLYAEANESKDLDDAFAGDTAGAALFYHPPARQRLQSFEAKSPFDDAVVWQVTQASPSGSLSRRGFVHQLATTDTTIMFNGGWLLPIGQDDALTDVYSVYTQLPDTHFTDVPAAETPTTAAESVVVRTATHEGQTYAYLINDAPWPATVRLQIRTPVGCVARSLGRPEHAPQFAANTQAHLWSVQLQPYDMAGVVFDQPNVAVTSPMVAYPDEVARNIETRLGQLEARMAVLGDPDPVEWLENPGFESTAGEPGTVPGWELSPGDSVTAQLIRQAPFEGSQSLRISNRFGTGWVASTTDTDLQTGRLFIRMAMRGVNTNQPPSVQIAMEAKHHGTPYRRVSTKTTVTPEWKDYRFAIQMMPLDGLTDVRVRLEVIGAGVVDIDDVEVFDLRFDRDELTGLRKQVIWPTRHLHHDQQYAECHRILDSYWTGFLEENVALPADRVARDTSPLPAPVSPRLPIPAPEPRVEPGATNPPAEKAEDSGFFNSVKKIFTWQF